MGNTTDFEILPRAIFKDIEIRDDMRDFGNK